MSTSSSASKHHYASEFTSLNGFGMKMLQKYGWKEGDGLGKDRDGRAEIITTKKRIENEGLGVSVTQKQRYWWENMYDNLLQKGTDTSATKKKTVQDSTDSDSSSSSEDEEPKKKSGFVKASTKSKKSFDKRFYEQEDSSSSDDSSSDEEVEVKKTKKITIIDNSLFSACEGRTLKKYRQTGKELRVQKAAEEAMRKIREKEAESKKRKRED